MHSTDVVNIFCNVWSILEDTSWIYSDDGGKVCFFTQINMSKYHTQTSPRTVSKETPRLL